MNERMTVSYVSLIDTLRGIAALAVAMIHFTCNMNDFWLKALSRYGWLGVDIFFVISGFVIPLSLTCWSYLPRRHLFRFLGKRLLRLHPAYIAVVLMVMLIPGAPIIEGAQKGLLSFISHGLLLNGILEKPWLVNVFWSLAIEMQFYILAGLFAPLLRRASGSTTICLLSLLLVALVPIPKVWILPHLPLFAFGITALLKHQDKIKTSTFFLSLAGSAIACWISLGIPQALVGAATSLAIVYANSCRIGLLSQCGKISYSLYLLHPVVGLAFLRAVSANDMINSYHQTAAVLTALVISTLSAVVWYLVIEKPSHKASSRIRYQRAE